MGLSISDVTGQLVYENTVICGKFLKSFALSISLCLTLQFYQLSVGLKKRCGARPVASIQYYVDINYN